MPKIKELVEGLQEVLKLLFPEGTPPAILKTLGFIMLAVVILLACWGLLYVVSKIKKLWVEDFWPLFYKQDERKRREKRQRFADHIEAEMRRLNNLEAWSDYRFTELEAEVEAEGRRKSSVPFFPFSGKGKSGLRREKSLSEALKASQERLIILEGDPGSGKSVALRHIARSLAGRAAKSKNLFSIIPIYVNLKELERPRDSEVNRDLIRAFILKSLNRVNDSDIEKFLEAEFDEGLRKGTWLFLFDSFDELPEVLSSTEADAAIHMYGDAISDFLHGFNRCRGIVASRHFRGPGQFGWPRFRILPLSDERRLELIRRADMDGVQEKYLIGNLGLSQNEIYAMSSNPMFLGLLCEHIKNGHPFPENAHGVFETYITSRMNRDSERIGLRFHVGVDTVRAAAEAVAFCMAADTSIGLNPSRADLEAASRRLNVQVGEPFNALLDALQYIKLARSEKTAATGESASFTFAHRRFQEYFATCVVLREQDRVSPTQLLTDARWRETAVVMCQTQSAELLSPIFQESRRLLAAMVDEAQLNAAIAPDAAKQDSAAKTDSAPTIEVSPFPWPTTSLHLLSILQDGFGSRPEDLPEDIRLSAESLIVAAAQDGSLIDKKWAIEVAGIVPQTRLLTLLRDGFNSTSQWLRDVAYRQASRLKEIPPDVRQHIRATLVAMWQQGSLRKNRYTVGAHIARLPNSDEFRKTIRLLLNILLIDVLIHFFICLFMFTPALLATSTPVSRLVTFLAISLGMFWAAIPLSPLVFPTARGAVNINLGLIFLFYIRLALLIFTSLELLRVPIRRLMEDQLNSITTYQEGFSILLFAFFVLGLLWSPCAIYIARRGQYLSLWWWPLFTPIALLKTVSSVPALLRKIVSVIIANPKEVIVLLGKLIGGVGVTLWTVSWIITRYEKVAIPIVLAIPPIMFLIFIFVWISDWVWWRRWVKSPGSNLTGLILLEQIARYRMSRFATRHIRAVRMKGLMPSNQDNEALLLDVAYIQELHSNTSVTEEFDNIHMGSAQFQEWFGRPGNRKRLKNFRSADFVDEVYKLYEQVRAKSGPGR